MSAPSFIISEGFLFAVRHGIRGIFTPQQKSGNPGIKVLRLALFTFCGFVLSGLAGPASGVLMIHRVEHGSVSIVCDIGTHIFFTVNPKL